jgi:hypothetical protein
MGMRVAGSPSRWTNRCVFSEALEKYTSDVIGFHHLD